MSQRMDIIIKSFNRPYLLDRCLTSITTFLKGFDGTIYIIDDGTPQQFLNKIKDKFPHVIIKKTAFYTEKEEYIIKKSKVFQQKIPIDDWIKTAEATSDYFLLLEDDMWFTEAISYQEIVRFLKSQHPLLLKLLWLGNPDLITSKEEIHQPPFVRYQPKLFITHPLLFRLFLINRFKIRKLLTFFGLYSIKKRNQYYSLYSVAGAVFKKDYFLNLWKHHTALVDEELQLKNAVRYCYQQKSMVFVRSQQELLKTSFVSAATNAPKKNAKPLDMFIFNAILNELWFEDKFSCLTEFEKDISLALIRKTLENYGVDLSYITDWENWVASFKRQYEEIGCKLT